MTQTNQVYDGEWIDVTDGIHDVCCDCGLVHRVYYEILEGRILRRVFVDKNRTSARRKTKTVKDTIENLKGTKMPAHPQKRGNKKKPRNVTQSKPRKTSGRKR